MLVLICFQVQILIWIVSCITRTGIRVSQKHPLYFLGFKNFNREKIVSKDLVVEASLTNTLHTKADITFSIFVQRKIGCIRVAMWNLHCSMKQFILPCLPCSCLSGTAFLLQQPPPISLSHPLKARWSAHKAAEQPLHSEQCFCWDQAGSELGVPAQAGTASPTGHSQGTARHRNHPQGSWSRS